MSLTVLYQYHKEVWYIYNSDLSHYVWLFCISITKKSDTSITVIYHTMSLTELYQYHKEEWYIYHSDLSHYVSDCTVQ
jgi:presenilin-like A22 family membrane protease